LPKIFNDRNIDPRSGEVAPKYAVAAIKKKFYSENPHVVLYGLMVRLMPT
jgi:hypothetical protein